MIFDQTLKTQLLGIPKIILLPVTGDHQVRIAHKEHMAMSGKIIDADRPFHMVRHMFLVPKRLSIGNWSAHGGGNGLPVDIHIRHDLGRHGMRFARGLQIGTIKGFVRDMAVTARGKASHHRGGNIARAGPHRNTDTHPAMSRSTSAL